MPINIWIIKIVCDTVNKIILDMNFFHDFFVIFFICSYNYFTLQLTNQYPSEPTIMQA